MDRTDRLVKTEDSLIPTSSAVSFLDYFPVSEMLSQSVEGADDHRTISSLGFMKLLNMQDFGPSFFDTIHQVVPAAAALPSMEPLIINTGRSYDQSSKLDQESSEVLNNSPPTPNSSSISSEFSGGQTKESVADGGDEVDEPEEEENQKNTTTKKHGLKPKKANQKRLKEPRFAFMTKSEVDHLEDGYRWRKYGQKAVKNSPFPRSYYRCTSASCNVKKRVERSFNDPTIVVTTYEGQHTHPSGVVPRPGNLFTPALCAAAPFHDQMLLSSSHDQRSGPFNHSVPLNCGYPSGSGSSYSVNVPAASTVQQLRLGAPPPSFLTDHGLLQDIVPWSDYIKKDE